MIANLFRLKIDATITSRHATPLDKLMLYMLSYMIRNEIARVLLYIILIICNYLS